MSDEMNDSLEGQGFIYPAMQGRGLDVIETPVPNAHPTYPTEKIQVRHLARDAERRLDGYFSKSEFRMKYSNSRMPGDMDAVELWSWWTATAKAHGVLDARSLRKADELSGGLAKTADQRAYYEKNIKPWLHSLRPQKRGE